MSLHLRPLCFRLAVLPLAGVSLLRAQSLAPLAKEAANETVRLEKITVSAEASPRILENFPATSEAVTRMRIEETINSLDAEDAIKYFPSLFVRKRNNGDTQPVMATRTWGVSSSARSLVYADGALLTALIANNNNIGAPRWGLVAPTEIERVEVLYGPFSAAFPGNSMGAVLEITTRLPEKTEASLSQTIAVQHHHLYGTRGDYRTAQTAASLGTRTGKLVLSGTANFQESFSQPLAYVTSPTFPVVTSGGYSAVNKLGAPANVLGATGLLHNETASLKLKVAYDLTPAIRLGYTFGWWRNNADAHAETYLRDANGRPTFAGLSGFASGTYSLQQEHTSHSVSLKTDTKSDWNFETVLTRYEMNKDHQRGPTVAAPTGGGTLFAPGGRVAVLAGTRWSTADFKARWNRSALRTAHQVSFGAHEDFYRLFNPTYNTPDWTSGQSLESVATEGDGKTRTRALWLQDVWQPMSTVRVTTGLRYEEWKGYDGYNANGSVAVRQSSLAATRLSPKAVVAWTPAKSWTLAASLARAYRFPTAGELYQLVSTGTTFTSPNPDLKPDNVVASELRIERVREGGRLRLSLFQDDVHDAIISQFKPLVAGSSQLYNYISNVDHVRSRGLEFSLQQNNLLVRGLEFSGSVTYLDARTLALSGRASATAAPDAAIGKFLPNIPRLRSSFVLTYRRDKYWAFTAAGRSSTMLFTTLDNADVAPNNYQGFSGFFVADVRVHYQHDRRWSGSLGVDNLFDREYFLFHPFPQRTLVMDASYTF